MLLLLLIYNSNLLFHNLKLAKLLTEVLRNVHSFRSHLLWVNFRAAFHLLQCNTLVIVLQLLLQAEWATFRKIVFIKIALCLFNLVVGVRAKLSQLNALLWVRGDIDWGSLKNRRCGLLLWINTTGSACWRSANNRIAHGCRRVLLLNCPHNNHIMVMLALPTATRLSMIVSV